ncbi:MAG: PAS domain S-box protein [Fimbriimonadaceae bacterium]
MGRRQTERAGQGGARTDASVCAVGIFFALVGLFTLLCSVLWPRALAGSLSDEAISLPVVPGSFLVLGASLVLLSLRKRAVWAGWVVAVLCAAVAVAAGASLFSVTVPPFDALASSWFLAAPTDASTGVAVMLRADVWVLLASVMTGLALVRGGWVLVAVQTLAVAVVLVLGLAWYGAALINEPSLALAATLVSVSAVMLLPHAAAVVALAAGNSDWSLVPPPAQPIARRFVIVAAMLVPLPPMVMAWTWQYWPTAGYDPIVLLFLVPLAVPFALLVYAVRMIAGGESAIRTVSNDYCDHMEADRALEAAGEYGTWERKSGHTSIALSESAPHILGVEGADIGVEAFAALAHREDSQLVARWLDESDRGVASPPLVFRRTGPNGEPAWLEVRGRRADHDATVRGTVRDATRAKAAEKRLRDRIALLEAVAGKVQDVDYVFDIPSSRYVYMNRPLGSLVGYEGPTPGTFIEDHVVEEDKVAFLQHIQEVSYAEGDEVREIEFRVLSADGSVAWLRIRDSVFVRSDDGTPVQVMGTVQNVTETKEAYMMLDAATEWFERVSAHSPGIVFRHVRSPDGQISFPYVGERVVNLVGITREELQDQPELAFATVSDEDLPELLRLLDECAQTLDDLSWVGRASRPDGSQVWVQIHAATSLLDDGTVAWDGVAMDVTLIKEAQNDLQKTKEKLDYILTQSPTVVYACEREEPYRISTIAPNVRSLLGLYADQLVHRPLFAPEFAHPDDVEALKRHERRFIDHGKSTAEYRMRTVSGDSVWVRDDVRIVTGEGDEVHVVGAWTDINDQKVAMLRLLEGEERHKRLASHVPGMVFELRLHEDGRPEFSYASPGSYSLVGLPPEEIVSRPETFLRLIDKDDKAVLYRELVRSQRERTEIDWEGTVRTTNGATKRVRVQARPGAQPNGADVWTGVATDVTEGVAALRSLHEAERLHEAMLDAVSDAIVVVDMEGRIVRANAAVERVLGFLPQGLVGRDVKFVLPDPVREDADWFVKAFLPLDADGATGRKRELFARKLDGTLALVEVSVLLAEQSGAPVLVALMRPVQKPATAPKPKKAEEPAEAIAVVEPVQSRQGRTEVLVIASEGDARRLLLNDPDRWSGFSMTVATAVGLGLELAKRRPPHVMVFVQAADQGTAALVEAVREDEDLARVPVVVIDRTASVESKARLMRSGATTVFADEATSSNLPELIGAVARASS